MGARLKFWRRSRVPKKGSRDEVFLAASPLVTAPPSNLTRIYYNGSATKSHSTTTQYRQLGRLGLKFFGGFIFRPANFWVSLEALGIFSGFRFLPPFDHPRNFNYRILYPTYFIKLIT